MDEATIGSEADRITTQFSRAGRARPPGSGGTGRAKVHPMATPAPSAPSTPAIRWFRAVALVEAVSYLMLLGAMVAKYGFDAPIGVRVMGPVHGVIFLVYAALAFTVREQLRWSAQHTFAVLAAAVIPLGGYLVERSLSPARAPDRVIATR